MNNFFALKMWSVLVFQSVCTEKHIDLEQIVIQFDTDYEHFGYLSNVNSFGFCLILCKELKYTELKKLSKKDESLNLELSSIVGVKSKIIALLK